MGLPLLGIGLAAAGATFGFPELGLGAGAAAAGTDAATTAAALSLPAGSLAGGASAAGTLSTLGAVGSGLGGIVSAVGATESASAQQQAASYQAQVARNNQQIALNAANQASAAGSAQVEAQGIKNRAQAGQILASQAASNIDVNTGSAVDVRSSAAALGQLDALTIRSNAEKQVYGYQTEAASAGGQASLAASEASQAPIAGQLSATGSLLSGATGVANNYLRWQQLAGNNQGGTAALPLASW